MRGPVILGLLPISVVLLMIHLCCPPGVHMSASLIMSSAFLRTCGWCLVVYLLPNN